MGLAPSHALDLQTPFTSLGFDSLMAVELRNALAAAMGHSMPTSLAYDYPTIEKLAEYFMRELTGGGESTQMTTTTPLHKQSAQDRLNALESLSDEEVERLFSAKKIG